MVFQASLKSLRSTFDPDGENIFLQEDIGRPEYLVTDVSTMDWPEKLELNMSERLVGGTNTKVFSLRPQLWIDKGKWSVIENLNHILKTENFVCTISWYCPSYSKSILNNM